MSVRVLVNREEEPVLFAVGFSCQRLLVSDVEDSPNLIRVERNLVTGPFATVLLVMSGSSPILPFVVPRAPFGTRLSPIG